MKYSTGEDKDIKKKLKVGTAANKKVIPASIGLATKKAKDSKLSANVGAANKSNFPSANVGDKKYNLPSANVGDKKYNLPSANVSAGDMAWGNITTAAEKPSPKVKEIIKQSGTDSTALIGGKRVDWKFESRFEGDTPAKQEADIKEGKFKGKFKVK
jgi:hypothetical protein